MNLPRMLRKHMNKLLWVLVIFIAIAFGVSATMSDVIRSWFAGATWARMFGREVSYAEFVSARKRLSALQGGYDDKVPDDDVWEHLILIEEAGRAGIIISGRELQEEILKAYREMIFVEKIRDSSKTQQEYQQKLMNYWRLTPQQRKAELESIQFNDAKYRGIIAERMKMSVPEFEQTYRELLLIDRLRSFIRGSAIVSSEALYEKFVEEQHQRKIDYVHLKSEDYEGKVEIKEDKLKEYYEKRKSSYLEPSRIAFEYVIARNGDVKTLLPEPTEKELEDFYELRKAFDFTRQSEQPEEEGVPSPEDIYQPYEEVKPRVKELFLASQVEKKARELVERVRDKVNAKEKITLLEVAELAAQEGLSAGETKLFAADREYVYKLEEEFGLCADAPRMFDNVGNIEELSTGSFHGPNRCDKGLYIYRLSRHVPKHSKSLEEVRGEIEKGFKSQEASRIAKEEAERILKKAQDQKGINNSVITEEKLIRVSTDFFKNVSNSGSIDTIEGNDVKVIAAAFEIEKIADFAEPVEVNIAGRPHYYVLQYKSRKDPRPQEFLGKRDELIDTKRRETETELFDKWKEELVARANVEKLYLKNQPEENPEGGSGGQPVDGSEEGGAQPEPDAEAPEGDK